MKFRSAAEARSLGAPLVRLFVTGLARSPSPSELAPMVERLRAGDDLGDAAAVMAAGAEFLSRHGPAGPPDHHYVRALFWAIDGQDPPDGETERLLAQPAASRASLLAQVSQSASARAAITLERHYYGRALNPADDVAYGLWLDIGGEPALRFVGPAPAVTVSFAVRTVPGRPDLLGETLASLAAQSSPHWEALVDGPDTPDDPRIRTLAGGDPLARAKGALIGFIQAGDQVAPQMVEAAARLFAADPALRLIYTDEDSIAGDGTRFAAVLKPGWSPDLLLSGDALGLAVLFNRRAALDAGGLDAGAGAFATLDLALRLTHDAPAAAVAHQPGILFHRGRAQLGPMQGRPAPFPDSRAGNGIPELDAVIDRFLRAHRPELERGVCFHGGRPWPTITAALPATAPRVSAIIPTRDRADLLAECLTGLLERTDYHDVEVLIVDNGSTQADALALLARWEGDPRVRVLRDDGPFNWSALNNRAAAEATGDVLLLLNNDVSVVQPKWLRAMVAHAIRPGVGVVGARLLFPDGRLQHGGVLLGPDGAAVHALTGADKDDPGYGGQVMVLRDLSAVTGACLAIRRSLFNELGGLEQDHLRVAWSDIDLCLRAREAGYRVLWNPDATLIHHEMATRGQDVSLQQQARHETERAYMLRRWPVAMDADPFRNPALNAQPDALVLRLPAADVASGDAMEELQLEIAGLKRALHRAEKDADRLRGLWPRAELQQLRLDLADRTAVAAQLTAERDALAARLGELPPRIFALALKLRVVPKLWRLARRVAGIIRRTPRRRVLLRQRRADYAVIAASPVFDRAWYRANAMDGDAATDPVAHYLWKGAVAGRDPHALFDSAWYASRTPGLGGENAFAHYIRAGMATDADPHPLFDTAFYLVQAPEAAGRALAHYMCLQPGDTRAPVPLFDPVAYPDGLGHYARTGAAADRDPHALFSTGWYRRNFLGGDPTRNPLAHWVREGAAAGLPTNPYGIAPATPARLPEAGPNPPATVIVTPGSTVADTIRTVLSVMQNSGPGGYEVVLAGPAPGSAFVEGLRAASGRGGAIAAAQGRCLVFLGAGAVVHPGWLPALLDSVEADEAIGMAGCKTLQPDGSLRSAGAAVTADGCIHPEQAGDPALPRHAFLRAADTLDPAAMLVRRTAWDTIGGFDDAYETTPYEAADLAFALRAGGWRVVIQPTALATLPGAYPAGNASDATRLRARWATALSFQPATADALAGWRAAGRRALVLAGAVPGLDDALLGRLLQPGARVAVHIAGSGAPAADVAAWERRGVEMLRSPVVLSEWLASHGGTLDEVWANRALDADTNAALLRWTGVPVQQHAPEPVAGGWPAGATVAKVAA